LYPTNNSAKTSSYPEKKRLCNYWRKNSLNRRCRSFFFWTRKNQMKREKLQKNERVEGRTENESLLFFTFPPGFFFSSFYLTSDTFIDWLSLDKEREKKTNFFVCN
jgi:hypothetical protein